VLDFDVLGSNDDPDDVESKVVTGTLKSRHPNHRRAAQFALLPPANLREWATESVAGSGLYFHEGYGSVRVRFFTSRDQIDIPMAILETMVSDVPAVNAKPSRCDALSANAHRLTAGSHGAELSDRCSCASIESLHSAPKTLIHSDAGNPSHVPLDKFQKLMSVAATTSNFL